MNNNHKASLLPAPSIGQSPLSYAVELGGQYGSCIGDQHRKAFGHYQTPASIAGFMGRLSLNGHGDIVRVLDPAAGAGALAVAAAEALAQSARPPRVIELVCYELDAGLKYILNAVLAHLGRWLHARQIILKTRIEWQDFVLTNAGALDGGILPSGENVFDIAICNPPYFKIAKSDPRAQAASAVVHGQPNIYGLFMAVSAAMLRSGGRFVFITPRSFASGPYFQRFREVFFSQVRPTEIHVFDSRKEAFDEVLQETVITAGIKEPGWGDMGRPDRLALSTSGGANDIDVRGVRSHFLSSVLTSKCEHRVLYLPASAEHDRVRKVVESWPSSLRRCGLEVSTGPVVAFRAKKLLKTKSGRHTAPMLWLQHVRPMVVAWPLGVVKPEYILDTHAADHVMVRNSNYVLLRRFSAKEDERRLTAAAYLASKFDCSRIGLENHLNYIYRPAGHMSVAEVYGLAALLNSELMDQYIRISSGNTQVSATELRAMPLPGLDIIKRIGERARRASADFEQIVGEEVGLNA